MKRKAITERMKIDALLYHFGGRCARCGLNIFPSDRIEWDHLEPIALGGPHDFKNILPLHADCHAAKTRGKGATTAGSDIGKIAKERRIKRTGKFVVEKPPIDLAVFDRALRRAATVVHKAKRKWPKRPFQKREKVA